eukprot:Skav236281  [mRNA]  locus=scaffold4278:25540:26763:+ [translate_table: standard]
MTGRNHPSGAILIAVVLTSLRGQIPPELEELLTQPFSEDEWRGSSGGCTARRRFPARVTRARPSPGEGGERGHIFDSVGLTTVPQQAEDQRPIATWRLVGELLLGGLGGVD